VRLFTRSDLDGSVCAAILQELGIVDEIVYIHPKDLQDGKVKVNGNDIIANVPYVEGCGLWFDHHSSEHERLNLEGKFKGASKLAPSAAQVIYEHYKDSEEYVEKLKRFEDLIKIVGIADSAKYGKDDILNPKGWIMLAFIADPRTGLGYKRTFRISNFELMKRLPDLLRSKTVEAILAMPDFQERIQVYFEETSKYKRLLAEHTRIEGNAIITDFRGIKKMPVGNRFIGYVLYPDQNISIRIADGKNNQFVMISVGHSIINRTSRVNVGSLMLKFGGGGHKQVGACQVKYEEAANVVKELLQVINAPALTSMPFSEISS
jgi:oligoribonuclease NrnB/cAMP/cGMP phosphodiesterase (DHH superfamily)